MEILELEKRILAFSDEVKSIFKKVKELAGKNEIIIERSRAYWYNNIMSWIDSRNDIMSWIDNRNHYHTMMQTIKELRKENE